MLLRKLAPGQFLFRQPLISLGQFARPQAQILHRHLIVIAQAIADLAHHGHGDAAAVVQHAIESGLVQHDGDQRCPGGDRGGARRVMDQRHFAEEISRAESLEQARLRIVDALADLHFAFEDHIKTILHRVLAAQHRAGFVGQNLAVRDQLFDFVRADSRKGTGDDSGGGAACGHV